MTYLSIIFSFDTLAALSCLVYLVWLLVQDLKTRELGSGADHLSIKRSLAYQKVAKRSF